MGLEGYRKIFLHPIPVDRSKRHYGRNREPSKAQLHILPPLRVWLTFRDIKDAGWQGRHWLSFITTLLTGYPQEQYGHVLFLSSHAAGEGIS